jgi:DNA-binding cell septation regulator SpoVG
MTRGSPSAEGELRRAERATWGTKPALPAGKILKWVPLRSGQMAGFMSVETPAGMIIHDLRLMIGKNGRPWIALPTKPVLDVDKRQKQDINGKLVYQQTIEFRDRTASDRFAEMVLAAVRDKFHEGLRGEVEP